MQRFGLAEGAKNSRKEHLSQVWGIYLHFDRSIRARITDNMNPVGMNTDLNRFCNLIASVIHCIGKGLLQWLHRGEEYLQQVMHPVITDLPVSGCFYRR